MRVAVNWSGGKDCCMASYYAVQQGYEISTLINFMFTNYGRNTPVWVLKYLTMDIGKSTPRKVSTLFRMMLRASGRRFSRSISKSVKSAFKTSGSTTSQTTPTGGAPYLQIPGRRIVPHEVSPEIVALQARAMGVPIIQKQTTWGEFDNEFRATARKLDPRDIEGGIVWGMLPPDPVLDHPRKIKKATALKLGRGWIAKRLQEMGTKAIFPLVDKTPEQVMADLLGNGFKVLIVVVNPAFIGEEWLGRTIDQDFINLCRKLNREKGVPILGDEYHTFVLDCPLFKKRIKIVKSRKVAKEGYSILEVSKAELVPKVENA
jgi:diphthine-ammonia ligase